MFLRSFIFSVPISNRGFPFFPYYFVLYGEVIKSLCVYRIILEKYS